MRKLAVLILPALFVAGHAMAQNTFDNQTGHAQNASRMSGLHTDLGQVHQMNTNAANSDSGSANSGTPAGTYGQPGVPLTTATAPPSQNGALPLAGAPSGMTPDGGSNSSGAPH